MGRFRTRFYKFAPNHHSLKILGYSVWSFYYTKGYWWFRIFGYGLIFKNRQNFSLTFSERNRYVKRLYIGKWVISTLNR